MEAENGWPYELVKNSLATFPFPCILPPLFYPLKSLPFRPSPLFYPLPSLPFPSFPSPSPPLTGREWGAHAGGRPCQQPRGKHPRIIHCGEPHFCECTYSIQFVVHKVYSALGISTLRPVSSLLLSVVMANILPISPLHWPVHVTAELRT